MTYFKDKMKALRREYTKKDRRKIIAEANGQCSFCERKSGDMFLFGPTHYLKKKLRFKVSMDIHVIEGGQEGFNRVVICNGCHISYHLFNRLSEDAEFGNKSLSDTLYQRCKTCKELNCMCCPRCSLSSKWCSCTKAGSKKKVAKENGKTSQLKVK